MTAELQTGRTNQKARTRMAIVAATRELIRSGGSVTMPAVAQSALVSEATAYRYFPDLVSLLTEALSGLLPDPARALEPIANSTDPVERVAFATEFLLRQVLDYQGAVRAMIAATITRAEGAAARPGLRFPLIDQALAPLRDSLAETETETDADAYEQLRRDLSVVVSAEALFSLTDLYGLSPDEAVASAVRTARTLTQAALHTMSGSHRRTAR